MRSRRNIGVSFRAPKMHDLSKVCDHLLHHFKLGMWNLDSNHWLSPGVTGNGVAGGMRSHRVVRDHHPSWWDLTGSG
jgi:hypothetical protein